MGLVVVSTHTQVIPAVQFPGGVQYESSSTAEEEMYKEKEML